MQARGVLLQLSEPSIIEPLNAIDYAMLVLGPEVGICLIAGVMALDPSSRSASSRRQAAYEVLEASRNFGTVLQDRDWDVEIMDVDRDWSEVESRRNVETGRIHTPLSPKATRTINCANGAAPLERI